jgi:seryl-tRNA synthetase
MATEDFVAEMEKDGALSVKRGEETTRYVKESDLLAIKESRDALQKKYDEASKNQNTNNTESLEKLAQANEAKNKAEAEVERLSDEIKKHTGTQEELEKLKTQLETAQKSGEEQGNKLLELTREKIVNTYKVPQETVSEKNLEQLATFEEALKAVTAGAGGNFAFGGGGGGGQNLEGKSPMDLARMAYASSDNK